MIIVASVEGQDDLVTVKLNDGEIDPSDMDAVLDVLSKKKIKASKLKGVVVVEGTDTEVSESYSADDLGNASNIDDDDEEDMDVEELDLSE